MLIKFLMNSMTEFLSHDIIPEEVSDETKVVDGKDSDENEFFHYQMDILWWYLSSLTISGTNVMRFKYLIKVAEITLVMPHSNA